MKKRLNDYTNDADGGAALSDPYLPPKRRGCFFARVLRTVALLFALFVVGLGSLAAFLYWRSVSAPIDAENASTGDLVGWLALRDLSAETPETRERLFDRYFETLGGDDRVVEPEKLELPPQARRFARAFFNERDDARAETDASPSPKKERPPYLRLDYYVAPRSADSPQTSEYVVSDDARPGPALLKRWNASRENATQTDAGKTSDKKKTPAVEKNVRLLVMQWFVAKRRAYDAAPDVEKQRVVEQTVDELLGWQELYEKIKRDATQKTTPRAEMLGEFEKTVESWNDFERPEELAKTLWFKDLIIANAARRETPFGRWAPAEPPRARKTTNADDAVEPNAANAAKDAFQRFFDADDATR